MIGKEVLAIATKVGLELGASTIVAASAGEIMTRIAMRQLHQTINLLSTIPEKTTMVFSWLLQ